MDKKGKLGPNDKLPPHVLSKETEDVAVPSRTELAEVLPGSELQERRNR